MASPSVPSKCNQTFSPLAGRGGFGHPQVPTGPVSQFLPPVLDSKDAPPEFQGTVPGGGGVGHHGFLGSLGTASVPSVGRVPPVLHVHVDDWRSPHLRRHRSDSSHSAVIEQ